MKIRLIDANAMINDRGNFIVIGAGDNICIDIADIAKAPTIYAVPVSELLSLRDNLYEDNLITMRGLRDLNMLIAKYEGGKDHAVD